MDVERESNMTTYSPIVIFLICVIYMFMGPTLIMLNKYILDNLDFPYPLFLSGLGVLVSAIVAKLAVSLRFIDSQRKESVEGILWYMRVLPVGLAHALTLACGNTVYLLLDVGFIQMLKTFTPVIILFTGYIAKIENPSMPVILSIVIITVGTALTCSFQPVFQPLGISVMLMSEVAEAVRLVLTQFLLQNLKFGVIEGQYVLAPASAFWLFAASMIIEFPAMIKADAYLVILEYPFHFIAASCMGLCINFLSYFVIQLTSSLTMKVLGTARNILTIFLGILFYNEHVDLKEGLGYTVGLLGFVFYNAAKMGYLESTSSSPLTNLFCYFKIGSDSICSYCLLFLLKTPKYKGESESTKNDKNVDPEAMEKLISKEDTTPRIINGHKS